MDARRLARRFIPVLFAALPFTAFADQDLAREGGLPDDQILLDACAGQPDGTTCNDGNPCTSNDACSGGACSGTPDPNPPLPGSHPCTAGTGGCARSGWCFNGTCDATPIDCSDGNSCTHDFCSISGSCQHVTAIATEELGALYFAPDRMTIHWDPPPGACQPRNYKLAIGSLSQLPVGSNPATEHCAFTALGTASYQDPALPGEGEGIWYVVRTQYFDQLTGTSLNGTYGPEYIEGVQSARQTSACP